MAFWNIKKANAEIEARDAKILDLEKQLATRGPDESARLADAMASNEELSKQFEQVSSDLATAKTTIGEIEAKFRASANLLESNNDAIDKAVSALGLTVDAKAPAAEKIAAIQTAVSANMAKMNVKAGDIPAGSPVTAKTENLTGFARVQAAFKTK